MDASKQGEIDPADGGPLNYNGHYIFGAYKLATGIGLGRTLPVERTKAIILWSYRGWEFVPTGGGPFTSYLFPVSGGRQEIISVGKQLVDDGIGSGGDGGGGDVEFQSLFIPVQIFS